MMGPSVVLFRSVRHLVGRNSPPRAPAGTAGCDSYQMLVLPAIPTMLREPSHGIGRRTS